MSNKKTPSEVFRYDIHTYQGVVSLGYNFRNHKDMILLQEGTLVNFIGGANRICLHSTLI